MDNAPKKEVTPQTVLAEIHAKFPNPKAFMQEIVRASQGQWAYTGKADAGSVVALLASIRTSIYGRDGEAVSPDDAPIEATKARELYHNAANFCFLVAAVYHGEATFIAEDGALLRTPRDLT